MTVPQALRLVKHWADEPPTHLLLRALMDGLADNKPKERKMRTKTKTASVPELDFRPVKVSDLYGIGLADHGGLVPNFDIAAMEERSRELARTRARQEHGIPV